MTFYECNIFFHFLGATFSVFNVTANHHLAMFGDHWSSEIGDITHLISHMTSQKQVVDRSYNSMRGHFSPYVILPNFVTSETAVTEV